MAKKRKAEDGASLPGEFDLRGMIAKEKIGEKNDVEINYTTGLLPLDYYNGSYDGDGRYTLGVRGGRYMAIISKSGVGKTTLAIQMAGAIVKGIPHAQVIHLDVEKSTVKSRILNVLKWTEEEYSEKYIHLDEGLTTDNVYKLIKKTRSHKVEHFDEIAYDAVNDQTGETVKALPPTVVILDSLSTLAPENMGSDEEKMDGKIIGAQIAAANSVLFRSILSDLSQGNIFLVCIAHISTKIETNAYVKTQAQVNFLRQDEHIAGGAKAIYLANYILKLIAAQKLSPDEEYGIKGFKVIAELIKSRAAPAGTSVPLVFDQVNGYNNRLSILGLMIDLKAVSGSGKYYLDELPDVKFTKKTFAKIYSENAEFKKAFNRKAKSVLKSVVPVPERVAELEGLQVERE